MAIDFDEELRDLFRTQKTIEIVESDGALMGRSLKVLSDTEKLFRELGIRDGAAAETYLKAKQRLDSFNSGFLATMEELLRKEILPSDECLKCVAYLRGLRQEADYDTKIKVVIILSGLTHNPDRIISAAALDALKKLIN